MRMNQRKESWYSKSMAKNTHRFVTHLLRNVMFLTLFFSCCPSGGGCIEGGGGDQKFIEM